MNCPEKQWSCIDRSGIAKERQCIVPGREAIEWKSMENPGKATEVFRTDRLAMEWRSLERRRKGEALKRSASGR